MKPLPIHLEVDRLYRQHAGKLITSLVAFFRLPNLEIAEDLVQETFATALEVWPEKGLPRDPLAWLFQVCKRKTLNELQSGERRLTVPLLPSVQAAPVRQLDQAFLPHEIQDNQLRLLFALCHPRLPARARVILTLKTLAGFQIKEIAAGMGMEVEAVKKSLQRAKARIRERKLPLKVPFRMQCRERLDSVHLVLYLMFNEGASPSQGNQPIRQDLCLQTFRLVQTLEQEASIANGDTQALLSLILFHLARFPSRLSPEGEWVDLSEQDRSKWDNPVLGRAIVLFNRARKSPNWSRYHFEAAISSLHCTAPSFQETDWPSILRLYQALEEKFPSPFVTLNRCLVHYYAGEPRRALQELLDLKGLPKDPHYHASLGNIYQHLNQSDSALNHYLEALSLSESEAFQKAIKQKIDSL